MPGVLHFSATSSLSLLWVLPFLGLLSSFAILPLAAPVHWHRHYAKWAIFWALAFVLPALGARGVAPTAQIVFGTVLHEYIPFILLLDALYAVTGGIHITGTPRASPAVNTGLLALGTLLAGVIGTMAASLLLVRPLIRINRSRSRRVHVFVYFILLVANIGGALSPLGNPPLLLGYLAGVPFLWPLQHLWLPTALLSLVLLASFFVVDRAMTRRDPRADEPLHEAAKLGIDGKGNLLLLPFVIATVFLAKAWPDAPAIDFGGVSLSLAELAADLLYVVFIGVSLTLMPKHPRRANEFTWAPFEEVAILFAAIFVTLIPALGIIAAGEGGPASSLVAALMDGGAPDDILFYAATGLLSAFLDNAPTYLTFFNFAGGDPVRLAGPLVATLAAISAGAAYFGALSYIGNAPNLMIKSLAESHGVEMPSFFAYIGLAALIAGPWLALVAWFFA